MKRDLIRFVGGKSKLADWIINNMIDHKVYIEPFGGGASVLLKKKPKEGRYMEIYNDIDDNVYNLFLMLRNHPEEMKRFLQNTPFSRKQFYKFKEQLSQGIEDPIKRACVFFYLSAASYSGTRESFAYCVSQTPRSGTVKRKVDMLYDFSDRLRDVIIENLDFEKCIDKTDSSDSLYFIDPPYVGTENYYDMDTFDSGDHERLAETLYDISGHFLMTYYDCDLVRELYPRDEYYWKFKETVKNQQMKEERDRVDTVLVANYDMDECTKYSPSPGLSSYM